MRAVPPPQGLYDGRHEHDACGVAFVATLTGVASHDIVAKALTALRNLEHRGASGAEPDSGDGAGILMQVPDAFLRAVVRLRAAPGRAYAVGTAFLPGRRRSGRQDQAAHRATSRPRRVCASSAGARSRPTPTCSAAPPAAVCRPSPSSSSRRASGRVVGHGPGADGVLPAQASRARDRRLLPVAVLAHPGLQGDADDRPARPVLPRPHRRAGRVSAWRSCTRASPPTPSRRWPLAHPYRFIAHNGEINTVKGNRNWMRAREALLAVGPVHRRVRRERLRAGPLFPICTPDASDSASFDEVLELLHLGGRSLPHAVLMMIPEAWENHAEMDARAPGVLRVPLGADGAVGRPRLRGVHRRHPDRRRARPQRAAPGALLGDRRRPGRARLGGRRARHRPATVVRKGRLQPGRMFLVDLDEQRIIEDDEIKAEPRLRGAVRRVAARRPDPAARTCRAASTSCTRTRSVTRRQQIFGYTEEELRVLLTPMARTGAEPIGSMGTDTPIAALSDRPRLLFDYFSQLFAQVTNPPLDAIREELVTSLAGTIGPEGNLLEPGPASCRQVVLPFPVIDNDELAKIIHINRDGDLPGYATHVVARPVRRRGRWRGARATGSTRSAPRCPPRSPAALASSCCPTGTRRPSRRRSRRCCSPAPCTTTWCARRPAPRSGCVVEAGDVREVHHVALLIGYGAAAVNPYLAMESRRGPGAPAGLPDRRRARAGGRATWSRRSARACSR